MYLVHALIVLCIILKKIDRKGVVCMTNFTADVSQIIVFIGVMAFIVSVITEALKKWTWFDRKVPTALSLICFFISSVLLLRLPIHPLMKKVITPKPRVMTPAITSEKDIT